VFDRRNTFEWGAIEGIREDNMYTLSVEWHTMALVEIKSKAYTLSPETEGVEI